MVLKRRLKSLLLGFGLACCLMGIVVGDEAFQGVTSKWQGFERVDFTVDGRRCWVVVPNSPAEGRPWIWRARFFGHEPQADIALLNEGFHVAYCDVGSLFGNPQAVAYWDAFYKKVTEKHGLNPRPALEGMSRGGLIIYNWAVANPEKVACIYGDAPVCDFKSWPGGKGTGKGSPGDWKKCLQAYRLDEKSALEYASNPVDRLDVLARAGVPILHVVGEADSVVPVSENTDLIEKKYLELGGEIQVIRKAGVGHHPHSLKDPAPIVAFVRKHTQSNLRRRSDFRNSRIQFENKRKGHVAFMGGSITQMDGYRPMVCADLQKRFPKTDFLITQAGISSTCSTTGAFRLSEHVLEKGPVDLLFVEFAVNDDQDAGHARQECIRGLEGIVRQALRHNPKMDIVVTYFVNPGMLKQFQNGKTPLSIESHESVVGFYGVSSVNLAKEIAERISAADITWQQFGGTHPKPFGNRICADMIDQMFSQVWEGPLNLSVPVRTPSVPAEPIDQNSYMRGRFVDLEKAETGKGWRINQPQWNSIPGSKRADFTRLPMLCGSQPGASFSLRFKGSAIGVYLVAGPDAGSLEASIDGGEFRSYLLYHRFSKGLHYPRTVLLGDNLDKGEHLLKVRIAPKGKQGGTAARIIRFVAN